MSKYKVDKDRINITADIIAYNASKLQAQILSLIETSREVRKTSRAILQGFPSDKLMTNIYNDAFAVQKFLEDDYINLKNKGVAYGI